jgi:hypothetical protein
MTVLQEFIATHSSVPVPTGALPRALRIDGYIGDPGVPFVLTAKSTTAETTSGPTDPSLHNWALLVHRDRYIELCAVASGLPCPITIDYDMIGDTVYAQACDVRLGPGVPTSLLANVASITNSSLETVRVLKQELAAPVLAELRLLNELVGSVLLRIPESSRRAHPTSDAPLPTLTDDGHYGPR